MRLVARMMLEAAEEYGDEYVATGRDGKEARLIIEEDIGARRSLILDGSQFGFGVGSRHANTRYGDGDNE
jgi:hypothetical protein